MRAAVDVMGGDKAPAEILKGCWEAASLLGPDDRVLLVGREEVVTPALAAAPIPEDKRACFQVVVATQEVAMDESPVEAIRGKPDSSIAVMAKLVAKGEADVAISAGNTGACVAAAQLRMRTLPGVARPGIAVVMPTSHGPVVVCDAGANPEPKPQHLQQYALMAGAYAAATLGVENPRVGLLSIGEEDSKGNAIVKETLRLLRDEPAVHFVGNVEGRDLFKGVVDVVVCDGFVGNTVLKTAEGLFESLFRTLSGEVQKLGDPALAKAFGAVAKSVVAKHDWQEHGGAPLLGVGGHCLICHGRSEARAIRNAIRVGQQLVASKVNEKIVERIAKSIRTEE